MRSLLLPALLSLAVLAGCDAPDTRPTSLAASTPVATASSLLPTPTPSNAAGEQARVLRVKDGDTFVLVDGREVRPLGIDSCEMSTPAGPAAKVDAQQLLNEATVTLRAEPGVDLDQFKRMLRYVDVHTSRGLLDFGEQMIGHDHTSIYAGRNDASPSYLDRLRRADAGGRICTGAAVAPRAAAVVPAKPAPKPESAPTAVPKSKAPSGGSFKNCSEVRAAGRAPIRVGEPGFSSKFDANHDGVGCE